MNVVAKPKSGLAQMRESIARLNESQGLLAAKTVLEQDDSPESELERELKVLAQSRAAMHTTAVRVTATMARTLRSRRRQGAPIEKLIEEVQANVQNDTSTQARPKGK